MRLLLLHGRDNPDQEMDNWGYNGPVLAHRLTGWPYFDRHVLEVTFFEDLVLCQPPGHKRQYFGDWELQEEDCT